MPTPSPPETFVVSNRHVACTVGAESVILHLDEGAYYSLNPVGTRIWELLQQPRTIDELVAAVLNEFEVSSERCLDDVCELVEALRARTLVVASHPDPR